MRYKDEKTFICNYNSFLLVAFQTAFTGCSNGKDKTKDNSNSSGSTTSSNSSASLANPFKGNTYKELRPGRDEMDYWYFESDTVVWWGDTDYKYTFTETQITLTRNGYHCYDLDYSFNEDKTVLTIGSPVFGVYTKQ